MDFHVTGLPPKLLSGNFTVKMLLGENTTPVTLTTRRTHDGLKWRYVFQSSAFQRVIGLVFFECSDFASNVSLQTGFQVAQRLSSVRINAPGTVYFSRFFVPLKWQAYVKPCPNGCVFSWKFLNLTWITYEPQLTDLLPQQYYIPGTHNLKLEVWNAFGSVGASMVLEVTVSLLLLNYSLSNFFANQNGTLNIVINQASPPDIIFIDFGDNSVFDSRHISSEFNFTSLNTSLILTVTHTYKYTGLYDIYFNVSNSVSSFEHWTNVVVEEKISGVELTLLTSSVVALLEDATVECLVEKGTNLQFEWDFGDGSDGEYTREDRYQLENFKTKSTAHHSYGIANSYNVSVHIFNNYESVIAYLNVTIQAVEPIEQLHLKPRIQGQYAAPLYRKKDSSHPNVYSTAPIEFETWVWRGSDVQFLFDFGDGTIKSVSSLLNAWSLPYATVKHAYTREGKYEVFVSATNLLSSVNKILEQPFYVEFPPEGLKLDKPHYIIRHHSSLTLHASVTQGTNVSYNWTVGNMHMSDTGNSIFLPLLSSGIYIVTVEAYNHVTDFGYSVMRRPNATANIYVQEMLSGIDVCIQTHSGEFCDAGSLDLPFDEEVYVKAKVVPSTETALQFVWQKNHTSMEPMKPGVNETRKTNVPYFVPRFQKPGWYNISVIAQNHISSVSSSVQLNLIEKVANLTSIVCQGPNLVNHPITYSALYWFGTNLTFQWDFGDGSPLVYSTSSSVQHVYKEVGEYWVTVNIWNKFSHANITTNMFFLHHMCRKPEISFLHQRNRVAKYDADILLEADISVVCKTFNIEYSWTVYNGSGIIDFGVTDVLHQRQLIIPRNFLIPGIYDIHLKVQVVGAIVYANSSSSLEVIRAVPVLFIEGGFVRWIGYNDSQKLIAKVTDTGSSAQPLRFVWSCVPQMHRNLPCFKDAEPVMDANHLDQIVINSSALVPNLGAIIINVTVEGFKSLSASQVLEIKQIPHMLQIDIECSECHDHYVNQMDRLQMQAVCRNCGNATLEYHWKVWILEDGKSRMHFSNYDCVQANGSTFFIVAPNSTHDEGLSNATYLLTDDLPPTILNISDEYMLAEKPSDSLNEDLPPFPNLPGFTEDNNTTEAFKLIRRTRNIPSDYILDTPNLIPYPEYPYEGDALYEDNATFKDFPYPDFMPFPQTDLSLGSPDYLITEEGLPGEGGSAAARHQSSQHLGILLTEDEEQILEEAGKPRMKSSGSTNVVFRNQYPPGDPLRDKYNRNPPTPHIVSRPRSLLFFSRANTTTGFNSQYLILKPGILKVGRSYMIQTRVVNTENSQEGFAMEYFTVHVGPINGRCTLMPTAGYSINFDFRLHCLEWKSDHYPLYYELSYSRTEAASGHLIYFGLNANVKFNLPAGYTSNGHNVYLNVIVRDNLGVSTKVCSLIRKVKPIQANVTLEQFVYNETFHPKSILMKLLGEKQNQAVLQKLHVLVSALNDPDDDAYDRDPDPYIMRSKIRQGFFEVLGSLNIASKVEAAQLVSVLNEIIDDVQTITLFELQKAYNIYKKIHVLRAVLYNFFASSRLNTECMNFLSKLSFAAHAIHPRSEELIDISRESLVKETKDFLLEYLRIEDPFKVSVPHLSAAGLYLTEDTLTSAPLILLKMTAVQLLDNSIFIDRQKEQSKRCSARDCKFSELCFMLVVHEYDYLTLSQNQKLPEFPSSSQLSVFWSLMLCNDSLQEDVETSSFNVSVYFTRTSVLQNSTKVSLKESVMNIHAISITETDIHHALLFYMKLDERNTTKSSMAIDILFRFQNYPALKEYDMKLSYPAGTSEMNVFIPSDKIKDAGIYYISILSNNFDDRKSDSNQVWDYEASVWKDVCLGKTGGLWSTHSCYAAETSNNREIHCRCSAMEATAYSVPLKWDISFVPLSNLMEPFFNPLLFIVFIVLLLFYVILLYLNFHQDKKRNLSLCPIPLKDNKVKQKQLYLISVQTGMYFNSGTTASVFVVLHGTKDVTETRQLIGNDAKKFCFQKGSVDVFLLSTEKNLGPLLKLEVWHNNQGVSPSWYLQMISVKDMHTGLCYYFNCHNWLSAEYDDGQIERELTVAESALTFKEVLYDRLLVYANDFNMWNAVVCETPATFFSGVQRLTCCLSFLLNSAVLLSAFQNTPQEVLEGDSLPHISHIKFLNAFLVALAASIPQIVCTVLFRFCHQPSLNMDPKLRNVFFCLSPYRWNCWLHPKRSTSSHSTHRSPSSLDGSDSLYSSFEDSSIISVPDFLEDSFLGENEEKEALHLSVSYSDLSDPVSPLQKTLSTWQTLENWLKKKQDLILKPDLVHSKRHSYVLKMNPVGLDERSSLNIDQSDTLDDSSCALQLSSSSFSEHSSSDAVSDVSLLWEEISVNEELNLCLHYPFLPVPFYYFVWLFLLSNVVGASGIFLVKASRYSVPHSVLIFKNVLICVVFSCLVITPVIIFFVAALSSILLYIKKSEQDVPDATEHLPKEKKFQKVDYNTSIHNRIEYFKKYLRPPKDQILEQFRQIAIQEKKISNLYSDVVKHVVLLVLLLVALIPGDISTKYHQKESVENALFRSVPQGIKSFASKYSLLSWLETDFLDGFLADHQCFEEDEACGMSTHCIIVGDVILRHFFTTRGTASGVCNFSINTTCSSGNNLGHVYEPRLLKGFTKYYFKEDEWQVLSKRSFDAYDELENLVGKLNTSSAASVEFLLFNPTFSTFISVSFLFEMTNVDVIKMMCEIIPITIPCENSVHQYINLLLNLIFFIYILFSCKNLFWKWMKHKSLYWKQMANYISCFFLVISVIYFAYFALYLIAHDAVTGILIATQLNSNVNVVKLAVLESHLQYLRGILIFLHLLQSFKVLSFSCRLRKMLRRLVSSQKKIYVAFCSLFFLILSSITLVKHFLGVNSSLSHSLFAFVKVVNSLLKDYDKPEVNDVGNALKDFLAILTSLVLVFIHIYLFSFIRSVLLNYKSLGVQDKALTVKDMSRVIKRKFSTFFCSQIPETVCHEDYVPPIDFLLFELERLADALVTKAENLFPDKTDKLSEIECYIQSECEIQLQKANRLKLSEVEFFNNTFEDLNIDVGSVLNCKPQERLISTMPRQTKLKLDTFMPSSFHASLGSERKYRVPESMTVLQKNRIRKTYPLCHVDSDSSASDSASGQDDKLDSGNSLSVRKTKSRGKGKSEDFDISIENCDYEYD